MNNAKNELPQKTSRSFELVSDNFQKTSLLIEGQNCVVAIFLRVVFKQNTKHQCIDELCSMYILIRVYYTELKSLVLDKRRTFFNDLRIAKLIMLFIYYKQKSYAIQNKNNCFIWDKCNLHLNYLIKVGLVPL